MKPPSKNISESLRGQSPTARGAEQVSVTTQHGGGPSMVTPGEGKVEAPPGQRSDRSAAVFTGPQSRIGGG